MPQPITSKCIPYALAITDENCKLEAMATLNFRVSNQVDIRANVATITFTSKTGSAITETEQSSSSGVDGHAERTALGIAINAAIANGWKEFIGLEPIKKSEQFKEKQYRQALQSLQSITIYTELQPCSYTADKKSAEGESKKSAEGCDKFFANLFGEGTNYQFYHSIVSP